MGVKDRRDLLVNKESTPEICHYCKEKFNNLTAIIRHRNWCRPEMLSTGLRMSKMFTGLPVDEITQFQEILHSGESK